MDEKVLIVEDDATLLDTLEYNLSREGYNVLTAADGLTGLAVAREENPDLIVLDVLLPGMDGFEVCRTLRREIRPCSCACLIMKNSKWRRSEGIRRDDARTWSYRKNKN